MKKKWTRALALLCTLALALTLAAPAFAEDIPPENTEAETDTSQDGETLAAEQEAEPEMDADGFTRGPEEGSDYWWKLSEDGTLTIKGTRMADWTNYSYGERYPWHTQTEEITNIIIDSGIENIGANAFRGCGSLTSIVIPNSVTSIGDYALRDCISLTSITIPNSVTSTGICAFDGCISLTSITIPNSVTSISDYAFAGCSSLTSITIPNSVTSIGNSAFSSCSSLTNIEIPSGVKIIGYNAFTGCENLTQIVIPDTVELTGESCFSNCKNLAEVTFAGGTAIEAYAFNASDALQTVWFTGDVVEFVPDYAHPLHPDLHFSATAEITAYYPSKNITWTEEKMNALKGPYPNITWVAFDGDDNSENPSDPAPDEPDPPTDPDTPNQPEPPVDPAPSITPDTPTDPATPSQTLHDLVEQVIASGNYDLARQLLESLLNDKQIFIDARVTEAMRIATEKIGGVGRGHQATENAYVYATYPQSFTEALQLARAEVNAAANSFTLDMSFPEGKQSPLGVYMTVYLKEAFDPALEYRWYCDDGSVGVAHVEACDNNGYKACAKFYAPHFSVYTVQPVSGADPAAPADTGATVDAAAPAAPSAPTDPVGAPVLKSTGGDVSCTTGAALTLVAVTVLGCVPMARKKRKIR